MLKYFEIEFKFISTFVFQMIFVLKITFKNQNLQPPQTEP